MKSIEERAKEAYPAHEYSVLERVMKRGAYIRGAKEQKAIDDAGLYKLKERWEKEAQINHDRDIKSIKERAKEFALDAHDFDCGNCDTCGKCKEYRKYVDIVTEQKKNDIEKACDWLKKELQELAMDEVKDNFLENDFKVILKSQVPDWLIDFRKAMEE